MLQWFDGRILSEESKRYIQNFLVVTRTRPEDDDLDANSDDILSDEELIIDNSTFEEAISTRVGSGENRPDSRLLRADDDGDAMLRSPETVMPEENSLDAFRKAQSYWPAPVQPSRLNKPSGERIPEDAITKIKAAARNSQRQIEPQQSPPLPHGQELRAPELRVGRQYSTEDIHRFVERTRQRKKSGKPFYKRAQLKVLEKSASASAGNSRKRPTEKTTHRRSCGSCMAAQA